MRVRYTSDALNDLAGILTYLGDHSPAGARNVAYAIDATVSTIQFMPKLGRRDPRRPDFRFVIVRRFPYRVTYQIVADELEILTISHCAKALS